jgi:flagellar assembly factor FliW
MRFESPRFGVIEADEQAALCFPEGLPGFPDCTRFIVMDHDRETPLRWLQCIDRPEVTFLIVEPEQIMASYSVDVPPLVLEQIGWDEGKDSASDVLVFVILNIDGSELSANLRAPVVVHAGRRRAIQMIMDDLNLPIRHRIAPG